MYKFEYNIPYTKSENCILISARDWVDGSQSSLIKRTGVTNIQKVLDVGYTEVFKTHKVSEGDTVLISKASSQIAYLKPFDIPNNIGKFANVHWMQVLGRVSELTSSGIELFYNKVLLKEVKVNNSLLIMEDDKKLYEVLKVGPHNFTDEWEEIPMEVEEGMSVLVNDGSLTKVELTDGIYYITEENNVIGYFEGEDLVLDKFIPLSTRVLIKPYEKEVSDGGLYNPLVDLDIEDISEVYDRDMFKVVNVGEKITSVKKDDIISVNRDSLSHICYNRESYFVANSDEYIRGRYV